MDSVPVKACTKCGTKKPATIEFFYRCGETKQYFTGICKVCHGVRERLAREQKLDLKRLAQAAEDCRNELLYGTKVKKCTKCGELKPVTKEYFYLDGVRLSARCKKCTNLVNTEYVMRNKAKVAARKKSWHEANVDANMRRIQNWRIANPEKVRASRRNTKARRAQAPGRHTGKDVLKQLGLQKGRCYWCGCKLEKAGEGKYHVDHREPLSRGGSNGPENIVCACPACNLSKHAKTPLEFAGRMF